MCGATEFNVYPGSLSLALLWFPLEWERLSSVGYILLSFVFTGAHTCKNTLRVFLKSQRRFRIRLFRNARNVRSLTTITVRLNAFCIKWWAWPLWGQRQTIMLYVCIDASPKPHIFISRALEGQLYYEGVTADLLLGSGVCFENVNWGSVRDLLPPCLACPFTSSLLSSYCSLSIPCALCLCHVFSLGSSRLQTATWNKVEVSFIKPWYLCNFISQMYPRKLGETLNNSNKNKSPNCKHKLKSLQLWYN